MNNILKLRGTMQHQSGSKPAAPTLPSHTKLTVDDVEAQRSQLMKITEFWKNESAPITPLIEVHYNKVVAKSNRIKRLLTFNGLSASDCIVGARFEFAANDVQRTSPRHVITYRVSIEAMQNTAKEMGICKAMLQKLGGEITDEQLKAINKEGLPAQISNMGLSKSAFGQIVHDVFFVNRFGIKQDAPDTMDGATLTTIYATKKDMQITDAVQVLNGIGLDVIESNLLNATTVSLFPDQYKILRAKAPYLIAMSAVDISKLKVEAGTRGKKADLKIPAPGNEPIIGVIDTRFDENVYFSDWVEYSDMIDEEMQVDEGDFIHGTEVTSIIVDGPALNPRLNDGCGRFRVRHFAVAKEGVNSSFTILKKIKAIVTENQDIKVWNLSLGSVVQTPDNFVSSEAAVLDELQNQYDVIFVVAGTNKLENEREKRLGAPADSINAMVVNATTRHHQPADYSRRGPVLGFYRKPDVSCFGGERGDAVAVYSPQGVAMNWGTSFAAPWIARKLAYLIHVANFSRQAAKALILDAASGWSAASETNTKLGYGEVPQRITDIIQTPNNEIRFVIEGTADDAMTMNYSIPVPWTGQKYNYLARATLCYFPKCDRGQGVDYTGTELDFYFGRVSNGKIESLNRNAQDDPQARTLERDARTIYRKWDNVKHVSDVEKSRFIPRKVLDNRRPGWPCWGFKVRSTSRGDQRERGLRFAIVTTLKEMTGRNRIDEFKRNCMSIPGGAWFVDEVDMRTSLNIYEQADAEVSFDDDVNGGNEMFEGSGEW